MTANQVFFVYCAECQKKGQTKKMACYNSGRPGEPRKECIPNEGREGEEKHCNELCPIPTSKLHSHSFCNPCLDARLKNRDL